MPRKRKKKIRFHLEEKQNREESQNEAVRKRNQCNKPEGLGICVHELRADEESYAVSVPKDTLAKLIVVSEINGVELEELINCILEKGIEEHGFYA